MIDLKAVTQGTAEKKNLDCVYFGFWSDNTYSCTMSSSALHSAVACAIQGGLQRPAVPAMTIVKSVEGDMFRGLHRCAGQNTWVSCEPLCTAA